MNITPEITTIISACIGVLISVFTAYLTHKIKQRDEEMVQYRKEREKKEQEEKQKRDFENQARDALTLGMARTMLLDNYNKCIEAGAYSIMQRDVYHELYEAYIGAGGNGVMTELAEKIVKLPTEK